MYDERFIYLTAFESRTGRRRKPPRGRKFFMSSDAKDAIVQQQLNSLIGLYQNHLELFLKWITIYSTVVAAIAVYIFNEKASAQIRKGIPLLIAVASLIV